MFVPLLPLLLLAGVGVYVSVSHFEKLLWISLRDGQALIIRGNPRISTLQAILDTAMRAGASDGEIVIKRDGTRLRVSGKGLSEGQLQRLRNVVSTLDVGQLTSPVAPAPRNLGQRVGLPWLAWKLHQN